MTWNKVFVAAITLFTAWTQSAGVSANCQAADGAQRSDRQPYVGFVDNFKLQAFGPESDFWDGRASLDVYRPFEWCLAIEIAPQSASALLATAAPIEPATADMYRADLHETENAERPLAIPTASDTYRATEAEILNIRVPTKISTTYADWLLTNGILVPKLNTPGQGVDLGYNLQLQSWY